MSHSEIAVTILFCDTFCACVFSKTTQLRQHLQFVQHSPNTFRQTSYFTNTIKQGGGMDFITLVFLFVFFFSKL